MDGKLRNEVPPGSSIGPGRLLGRASAGNRGPTPVPRGSSLRIVSVSLLAPKARLRNEHRQPNELFRFVFSWRKGGDARYCETKSHGCGWPPPEMKMGVAEPPAAADFCAFCGCVFSISCGYFQKKSPRTERIISPFVRCSVRGSEIRARVRHITRPTASDFPIFTQRHRGAEKRKQNSWK